MITQYIKPMIQADISIKVKVVIAEIQFQYVYTRTYWKARIVKQKAIERIYGG